MAADAREAAGRILRDAVGDRLRLDYPTAPLTSFRLGGPAALYLEIDSPEDLAAAGRAVRETAVPFVVIGKGSNVLVADAGFPGLMVRLGRTYRWAARDGSRIRAGGAMPLPALAGVALSYGLAGLEFGVAIPASLGGSVRMNAGAHGHSMDEVLDTIEVFDLATGENRVVTSDAAGFGYRTSSLPDPGVVVAATFALRAQDPSSIREEMESARAWRKATQPLAEPNCGSVFKNPPGDHAARLIEAVGGKELAVGAARVSEKHTNFIIAGPGSTASDVHALMTKVRELVRDRFGVTLETEVRLVGDVA